MLMSIGAFLSLIRPETFGHFGDFTRETRGEVTLWYALGLRAFLASFACYGLLSDIRWYSRIIWIIPWFFYVLVLVMTFTRSGVIADFSGLLIALFLHRSFRVFAIIGLALIFLISMDTIQFFIFAEKNWDSWLYSEPRIILWKSHLEAIQSNLLLGMGNKALDNKVAFDTIFQSEIGLLAWISRYGILYATCMGFLFIRGVTHAARLFMQNMNLGARETFLDLMCPIIVFSGLPIHLFTGYSRILEFESFAYYYSLFYCFYRVRKFRTFSYTNIKNLMFAFKHE